MASAMILSYYDYDYIFSAVGRLLLERWVCMVGLVAVSKMMVELSALTGGS